jgi:hypothetical protein
MFPSRVVDLKFSRIKHETEKAFLFVFGSKHEVWLPKSLCEVDLQDKVVTLPENIAVDREIENYAE